MTPIVAEARVRARNQITIPDSVVQAAGVSEGDRFVVEVEPDRPDTLRLHRIRTSYAGSLGDVYGDVATYVDEERSSWS